MKTKVQDAQERREPKQNLLKAWMKKARGKQENKNELVKAKQVIQNVAALEDRKEKTASLYLEPIQEENKTMEDN